MNKIMKNLKKFNEDVLSTREERFLLRFNYVIDSFNENFLEFLDNGYQYKMKAFIKDKFLSNKYKLGFTFNYENRDTYLRQLTNDFNGLLFYIVTPHNFQAEWMSDLQIEENKFDVMVNNMQQTIQLYKESKEIIQDNIDRLVGFYKLELDGGLYISKYTPHPNSPCKLTFSIRILI